MSKRRSRVNPRSVASAGTTEDESVLPPRRPRAAVGDAIDRAGVVVGDEQRAVLHHLHVDRPADIAVVLEEAGHERLERLDAAVTVERDVDHIAANLARLVPRAVARDEDAAA